MNAQYEKDILQKLLSRESENKENVVLEFGLDRVVYCSLYYFLVTKSSWVLLRVSEELSFESYVSYDLTELFVPNKYWEVYGARLSPRDHRSSSSKKGE